MLQTSYFRRKITSNGKSVWVGINGCQRAIFPSSSSNQYLASCTATILHEPIHFGVNDAFPTWEGFLTGTQLSMMYGLISIYKSRLHRSAHRECIASTSIILASRSGSCWNYFPLKSRRLTRIMARENRRAGKAANIISYWLYPSFPLFARIAFMMTGKSSSHSASQSMRIRVITCSIVCTILSARQFDNIEYATVVKASVPSSFNAFFLAADENSGPWLVSTTDGPLNCLTVSSLKDRIAISAVLPAFALALMQSVRRCTLNSMYRHLLSVSDNGLATSMENLSKIQLTDCWLLYSMFFSFAYSRQVRKDWTKSIAFLLIVGY